MNWFSLFVMYLIIWWVVLFGILPIGIKGQAESNDIVKGSEPGAPVDSQIKKKFIITTIVATIIWAITCAIIASGWVSWDMFGALVKQNEY